MPRQAHLTPQDSALLHDRCRRNRPLGPVHTLEVHDPLVDEIEAGLKHRRILLEAAIAGAYLRVVWSGSVAGSRFGAVRIPPASKRLRKGTCPDGESPLTESAPKLHRRELTLTASKVMFRRLHL